MIHNTRRNVLELTERPPSRTLNFPQSSLDCGIAKLPFLNVLCKIDKCGNLKVFLLVLTTLAFLQGISVSYYKGTSNYWMKHYSFTPQDVDWLLYMGDIFIGIFAFTVAFWGNRIHRMSWLGSLTIFQAVASLTLIIPELYSKNLKEANLTSEITLCNTNPIVKKNIEEHDVNYVALVIFYLYEIFYALGVVSLYTHGFSYLDDNSNTSNTGFKFCVVLASYQTGKQVGMYLSWITFESFLPKIFFTPIWLLLSILIFLAGLILAMFPIGLPKIMVKKAVESILNFVSGGKSMDEIRDPEEFWATLLRLIKNKLLMANVYASVFMNSALINFNYLRNDYYQARFHVFMSKDKSRYHDPWLVQILINLMKQPLVVLSILTTGIVVVKFKPKSRNVAIFNFVVSAIATVLFASYAVLSCEDKLHTEFKNKLSISFCNHDCNCKSDTVFAPVCTTEGQKTYFSPCHAGCSSFEDINGIRIYRSCSCGSIHNQITNTTATDGSCNSDNCSIFWGLAQINGIVISALLATTLVTNLLINLRCIYKTDKAMALAFEATVLGILPYFPLKIIYSKFEEYFCLYWDPDKTCKLHSNDLGTFVSTITVVLMAISLALVGLVIYFIKDLDLYGENKSGSSQFSSLPKSSRTNDASPKSQENITDTAEETEYMMSLQGNTTDVGLENRDMFREELDFSERINNQNLGNETSSNESFEIENSKFDNSGIGSFGGRNPENGSSVNGRTENQNVRNKNLATPRIYDDVYEEGDGFEKDQNHSERLLESPV